jgi:DNA polymerase IV
MQRTIFHIDINSYFATMLQQENPALRGKVVGVIKGVGRSCIIASSNEAKKLGIKTGCVVKDAKVLAPDIILVPANFDLMLSATRKLKTLFETLSPSVDVFSLDEVFLDLTGCDNLFRNCHPEPRRGGVFTRGSKDSFDEIFLYAQHIQQRIKQTLGEWVQCNVGISYNKLLAKMAGEIAPKGSVLTIDKNNLDQILSTIDFADVCGVGWGLSKKLSFLGVSHPYEINLLDDQTLRDSFGPYWSDELRKIGRGEETHFFHTRGGGYLARTNEYQKSVGRTITGYKLCDDEDQIRRVLLNLLEEATHKLRKMDLVGRKVGLSLWGHDSHWGEYTTLQYWVRHTDEVFDILYHKMYKKWQRDFSVIKFGVWIGECKPARDIPLCWLQSWHKREKVYGVIDRVNDRFGNFTLMPASLLGGPIIKPEVTGYLGDKIYLGL